MQGRIDVMRMMMRYDHDGFMAKAIAGEETNKPPPSLLNLAIANDFTECAQWWEIVELNVFYWHIFALGLNIKVCFLFKRFENALFKS